MLEEVNICVICSKVALLDNCIVEPITSVVFLKIAKYVHIVCISYFRK